MRWRPATWLLTASWIVFGCGGSSDPNVVAPDATGARSSDGGTSPQLAGCAGIDPTYSGFASAFFADHCLSCHSVSRTGDARLGAPPDVNFDDEPAIEYRQARILVRAVQERTMPPTAPLSACEASQLETYLAALDGQGACMPACDGKDCGNDGCGGSCGTCADGQACAPAGTCVDASCKSSCEGIACGDDGCGGSCGQCGTGFGCGGDQMCHCAPQCDGKSCGDDGCGGSCGQCATGSVCGLDGVCVCVPRCDGKSCGADGCGGSCGSCAQGESCSAGGTLCECVPDCTNKKCGDDGCGGSCPDTCMGALTCRTRTATCEHGACAPDCTGRECGSDNCGGYCGNNGGACADGQACSAAGICTCAPSCAGKACGDDGCGGSCGSCAGGLSCSGGQCGCTADCSGRQCGSDGCGGSCGTCGSGLSCSSGSCVAQCAPSCAGKACGDDGCGGSCGACAAGQACSGTACIASTVTFADVYAIFQKKTCASMGCHAGAKPAESLDLSSASIAQANLVGVAAQECSAKKRVLAGDPARSYLVNKLTGSGMCSGSQMPKGATPLSSTELDTVRTWISAL